MSAPNNILTNVRIIKRHNAGGVIIGILAILSIVVPAWLWVFPWFQVSIQGVVNTSSEFKIVGGIYSLDVWQLILGLFNKRTITYDTLVHNDWAAAQIRENVLPYYLVRENLYAAAIWYFLSAFFAILLFIEGIVLLIRGRVNHPFGIVTTAFFAALANGMMLLDSWRLGAYAKYDILKAFAINGSTMESYFMVFWPNIIIASVAGGIWLIMLIIYLCALSKRYYMEDIEFVQVDRPQPFERNNGVIRNTLPDHLTSIGGHAFAKNTNLEIASIPSEIEELGQGAFSNCLRLKVVSIPLSVKKIGPNCFFNTPKLKRINYGGTKEQWRYVKRGSNWLAKAGTTTVMCRDGAISVNPHH